MEHVIVEGHAATFNVWADLGSFRETIKPGAFAKVLRGNPDIRLLVNHEGLPLARTTTGSLELREDRRGLFFSAKLDTSDPDVQRILPKLRSGVLDQMSFAFDVLQGGQSFKGNDRTITEFHELFEVSLVTFPAFEQSRVTSVGDPVQRSRAERVKLVTSLQPQASAVRSRHPHAEIRTRRFRQTDHRRETDEAQSALARLKLGPRPPRVRERPVFDSDLCRQRARQLRLAGRPPLSAGDRIEALSDLLAFERRAANRTFAHIESSERIYSERLRRRRVDHYEESRRLARLGQL